MHGIMLCLGFLMSLTLTLKTFVKLVLLISFVLNTFVSLYLRPMCVLNKYLCHLNCVFFKGHNIIVSSEITFAFAILMMHKWQNRNQPNFNYLVLTLRYWYHYFGGHIFDIKCWVKSYTSFGELSLSFHALNYVSDRRWNNRIHIQCSSIYCIVNI